MELHPIRFQQPREGDSFLKDQETRFTAQDTERESCNKLNCADKYGDSRLSCNATMHVTNLLHNPVVYKLAELARITRQPSSSFLAGRAVHKHGKKARLTD